MNHSMEKVCQLLHEKDYKVTPQRQVILKTFLENASDHLSAEDIYRMVKTNNPEVGLATVYRTLDLLAELGILKKLNFDDGKARYEFGETEYHHHHHLICLKCGNVIEFEDDLLETLETMIAKKTDFEVCDHQLKIFGFCKNCRA